jgi:AraC family transcriptional regulator
MATNLQHDRFRSFVDLVAGTLDEAAKGTELAQRAYLTRFHFDRLFTAVVNESPAAFRRRLLLERAAYRLVRSHTPVTEIALDSGYGSNQAFTRAFDRAFGISPSEHRRRGVPKFRLDAPSGVHFHPPAGLFVPSNAEERRSSMDLTDRLIEHDRWLTGRMLDAASALSEEQLDAPMDLAEEEILFLDGPLTVRSIINRLVFTKEVWTAALRGTETPEPGDDSLSGMRGRLEAVDPEFLKIVRQVRDRDDWDAVFVDPTCDPPRSFTFGAMVAHVLTFQAYRRQLLLVALKRHGVTDLGFGDPIEWEQAAAS